MKKILVMKKILFVILSASLFFVACKNDDDQIKKGTIELRWYAVYGDQPQS